jgi:hypothetical protein
MTNVRKRRLYPLINGRRKPKTQFDHCVVAQHTGCSTKKPTVHDHSGSIVALKPLFAGPLSSSTDTSPSEFYSDGESSQSTPWEDEENAGHHQNFYPDVQFHQSMELTSPFNLCSFPDNDRALLEIAQPFLSPNLFRGSYDIFDEAGLNGAFSPDFKNKQQV